MFPTDEYDMSNSKNAKIEQLKMIHSLHFSLH